MQFKSFMLMVALFVGLGFSLQAQDYSKKADEMTSKGGDIVMVAMTAGDFNTLVAAVKAADLVETLQAEGPYTVFAPTDKAFEAVGQETLTTLLKEENKDQLAGILTYHVVAGEFMAKDVLQLIEDSENGEATIPTVAGGELKAMLVDDQVVLVDETGARVVVTQTDVDATNGVIHVVNAVLMPGE